MQYPRQRVLTRFRRWIPAIVYMLLIFYSSSQPDPAPLLTRNIWDKSLHAAGYAGLTISYIRALAGESLSWTTIAAAAAALASVYAATDELHQLFTPGRIADVRDWLADTAGAVLAAGGVMFSTALRRRRRLRR